MDFGYPRGGETGRTKGVRLGGEGIPRSPYSPSKQVLDGDRSFTFLGRSTRSTPSRLPLLCPRLRRARCRAVPLGLTKRKRTSRGLCREVSRSRLLSRLRVCFSLGVPLRPCPGVLPFRPALRPTPPRHPGWKFNVISWNSSGTRLDRTKTEGRPGVLPSFVGYFNGLTETPAFTTVPDGQGRD